MGQWLILVGLAKCLQDVCLGCLFPPPSPPPLPVCLGVMGQEWQAPPTPHHHCHHHPPSSPSPHTPRCHSLLPVFLEVGWGGGWAHHRRGTKATWNDRDLLSWPEPLFVTPTPSTTTSMCCLFSVCWWCMMGEVLTQHWGAVTLHCQRGWLAYHSPHWEEIHHHSRQGFPSLGPAPCLLLLHI